MSRQSHSGFPFQTGVTTLVNGVATVQSVYFRGTLAGGANPTGDYIGAMIEGGTVLNGSALRITSRTPAFVGDDPAGSFTISTESTIDSCDVRWFIAQPTPQ